MKTDEDIILEDKALEISKKLPSGMNVYYNDGWMLIIENLSEKELLLLLGEIPRLLLNKEGVI